MLRGRMQNVLVMRPAVRRAFRHAMRQDVEPALAGRPAAERDAFLVRLERFFTELFEPFVALYGGHPRFEAELAALVARSRRPTRPARPSCAASTTSARSRPTGISASRVWATSPTSTASPGRSRRCGGGSTTSRTSA